MQRLMQRIAMSNTPTFPITVFYDGSCSVCASEIEHYRCKDHENRLVLVDISASDFKPDRFNIDLQAFMYELHVIDQQGNIYKGIEAFWAIWQAFPASTLYGTMGTLITLPVINPLAQLCYRGFARIRRYLPKTGADCADNSCRIGKKG
jgi:predicted DCC family thiol-disulfide oxidoreductase YuxK